MYLPLLFRVFALRFSVRRLPGAFLIIMSGSRDHKSRVQCALGGRKATQTGEFDRIDSSAYDGVLDLFQKCVSGISPLTGQANST